jgi:hypothetical protein
MIKPLAAGGKAANHRIGTVKKLKKIPERQSFDTVRTAVLVSGIRK